MGQKRESFVIWQLADPESSRKVTKIQHEASVFLTSLSDSRDFSGPDVGRLEIYLELEAIEHKRNLELEAFRLAKDRLKEIEKERDLKLGQIVEYYRRHLT